MASDPPPTPKAGLRREMRHLLAKHSIRPGALVESLVARLGHQPLRRIATYSALPGEADLADLPARLPDFEWHYPRVAGENLTLHHITDPATQLAPGTYGILEPLPDLPAVAIDSIDCFLCPGLAFDTSGARLGRGRGYYDRLLAAARGDAIKIGVGHSIQLIGTVPAEEHDVRMDEVICKG